MGDFTGFTFGGVSSSDLGITRVSGGDRYKEQLQPEIKDITAEVPGGDGEYYFGSNYGPKNFDIEVAFDHLTEAQFRELRKVFGTRNIKQLIFDESPYKKYMAKLESPIELSYICFDEPKRTIGTARDGVRVANRETTTSTEEIDGEEVEITTTTISREQVTPYEYDYTQTERIYKGEGSMTFVCYFPFAKSAFKQLPYSYQKTTDEDIQEGKKYFIKVDGNYLPVVSPTVENLDIYYERVDEESGWAISSGILSINSYENFDKYDAENNVIAVYNAGDIETGFRLYLPAAVVSSATTLNYKKYSIDSSPTASLILNAITLKTDDVGVLVDTVNELVIGVSSFSHDQSNNAVYTTSGNIYNKYINSGYFFHLEPNEQNDGASIEIIGGANGIEIFYDYLYF